MSTMDEPCVFSLAADEITRLRQQVQELKKREEDFHMDYRLKCDVDTKRLEDQLAASQAMVQELQKELACYRPDEYADKESTYANPSTEKTG